MSIKRIVMEVHLNQTLLYSRWQVDLWFVDDGS